MSLEEKIGQMTQVNLNVVLVGGYGSKDGTIDKALLDKLPEVLTQDQKLEKIHNLLTVLSRKERKIRNIGGRRYSRWVVNTKWIANQRKPKKTKA